MFVASGAQFDAEKMARTRGRLLYVHWDTFTSGYRFDDGSQERRLKGTKDKFHDGRCQMPRWRACGGNLGYERKWNITAAARYLSWRHGFTSVILLSSQSCQRAGPISAQRSGTCFSSCDLNTTNEKTFRSIFL